MRATEAAETLRNITYRPGWTFDAKALSELDGVQQAMARLVLGDDLPRTMVLFHFVNDTVDTNREYAADGYQQEKVLEDTIPLDAADFDSEDDLLFAIFQQLMRFELHESREFFRLKNRDYNAPFHPHKAEGNALWEKCMARSEMSEDVEPTDRANPTITTTN